MLQIKVVIDGKEVKVRDKNVNQDNLSGALLLAHLIDTVRAFGIVIDEEFVQDFVELAEPEPDTEGQG